MGKKKPKTKIKKEKDDDVMSVYIKPIQATPTLSGEDAISIIKQSLTPPTPEAIKKNRKMLEIRKRIEKK